MIENTLLFAAGALVLSGVALVAGRYLSRMPFPAARRVLVTFLWVWMATTAVKFGFGVLAHMWQWDDAARITYAEFLLPLLAGAVFARHLLLRAREHGVSPPLP